MGTNYISLKLQPKEAKKRKETKFIKHVAINCISDACREPNDHKNVIFITHDNDYGDVFITFDDDVNDINIYFGEKGDEFDD